MYNPISVALTLYNKEPGGFSATWATTGRPSMLMNFLKREELLALDPRPHYQHEPQKVYGMKFGPWNVRFRICGTVLTVEELTCGTVLTVEELTR